MSAKDGAGYYPKKPKNGKRGGYDTTGRPTDTKGLAILSSEEICNEEYIEAEIEETDTRGTQVEDDMPTWEYLDSDADPEDVDQWEYDMGLKDQYEHPTNRRREMRKDQLRRKKRGLEEILQDHQEKAEEEAQACSQLSKLMRGVRQATQEKAPDSNKDVPASLAWRTKDPRIEVRLPLGYSTDNGGRLTFDGGYVPPEFLQRVRAIESQLQQEYDQYRTDLHPKR